jgi:hypothetical protein
MAPQTNSAALDVIMEELMKAEKKHPIWPADPIHAAAIVAEESGELVRASLQFHYEKGSKLEIMKEAAQTAATCIRLLKNL